MGESEIKIGDFVYIPLKSGTACDGMTGQVTEIRNNKASIRFGNHPNSVSGFPLSVLVKQ